MSFSKRFILYISIILLIASIYKDLSLANNSIENYHYTKPLTTANSHYSIVKVKVEFGDTVISIVEDINKGNMKISLEQIMDDFQHLNPNTNSQSIQPKNYYYFPLYK
ncbi:hypothetical protein [Oceanobacillus sp. Castelsardo]|uniref:hypothetical protein n=1 Tax=Oceanobacillus sp. Castelsardo TaxID=1851204 RepID=UPI0008394E41|nr:hypothetical protein [Oceanobacillus sp. Castelsardo]